MRRVTVTVGLMAALGLLIASSYAPAHCQSPKVFTTDDRFAVPGSHGLVKFAFNGTYTSATLNDGTWQFNDLMLDGTLPLGNLKIAAQDSNVTVLFYRTGNLFLRSALLIYTAEGNGSQTINLCLNNTQSTNPSEWSVITAGSVFLAEGGGWKLLPNDSVIVSGIEGNITVVHYNFQAPDTSDQPLYVQHSVGLASAAVVAGVVVVALAIKYREKR